MKALPDHAFSLCKTAAFLIALFFCLRPVAAQNDGNLITSFKAEDEQLNSVLSRLATNNGINLTYNATEPSFKRKVNYSATEKPVQKILEEILLLTHHEFTQVGNHIVIFPSEHLPVSPDINKNEKINHPNKPDYLTEIVKQPVDTIIRVVEVPVMIRDTLRIVDVVTKTDTITIRDTVFIERVVPQVRRTRSGAILRDVFRFEPDRADGWALSFSYAQLVAGYTFPDLKDSDPDLEMVKDSESASVRNFALSSAIQLNKRKFSFSAGLQLSGFSNRFSYSNITSAGGFYAIDTLDIFYTIIDDEPVYTYITDSTWIPLDRDEFFYDQFNRIGLLELQLGVGYTLFADEDVAVYVNGAFSVGAPLWLMGSTIEGVEGYPAIELNKDVFAKWTYAWQAGFGAKYSVGNWADIYGELFYKRYISETVQDYPLNRRLHGGGLKVGLLYYF
jgi:hypothetical protein